MQYSLTFKKSIVSFLLTTTGLLLPAHNHLSAFSQESSDQETKLHSTPNSPSFFQPSLDEKLRAALQFDLLDDRGEWIVDLSEDQLDSLKERIELMDELIACSVVLESQASDERTSPAQSGVLKAASSILSEMKSSERDNSRTFLATILNPQQMEAIELYQNNRRATYFEKHKKLDARSLIFLGEAMLRIADRGSVEAFRGIDRKATPPALKEKAPESLIQFEGYWFHSQPVQFSASSWKMIENTIETTETYKDFVHHFPGVAEESSVENPTRTFTCDSLLKTCHLRTYLFALVAMKSVSYSTKQNLTSTFPKKPKKHFQRRLKKQFRL